MSAAALDDLATGDDDDWVVLSPRESPTAPATRPAGGPNEEDYINFQLRTRLGTLSFAARPLRKVSVPAKERATSIHPQEQSRLFRLPVELRLEIYEHLFRLPASGSASTTKIVQHSRHDKTPTRLSVLLTCRRALMEAETIFYSINHFSFQRPHEFLASLGPRRRSALTTFTVEVAPVAALLGALEQLHALPNLTSLYIQRQASAKYLDVSGWAVMAPQLIGEMRKMQRLAVVEILTPEASSLTEHEKTRKKKLDGIDLRLEGAVSGRGSNLGNTRRFVNN